MEQAVPLVVVSGSGRSLEDDVPTCASHAPRAIGLLANVRSELKIVRLFLEAEMSFPAAV